MCTGKSKGKCMGIGIGMCMGMGMGMGMGMCASSACSRVRMPCASMHAACLRACGVLRLEWSAMPR